MRGERIQLPVRLVLQYHDGDNCRFLRYVPENGGLHFDGTDIRDPLSLLQAEREEEHYHIKTCYSDKYWARSEEKSGLVSASADEPEENPVVWSCTLLKPSFPQGTDRTRLRFFHVQSGSYLSVDKSHHLIIASNNQVHPHQQALFTVIDWDSVVKFPRYVAFKGDNGRYLCAFQIGHETYHSFSAADREDKTVAHEVISAGSCDGSVRIRSVQSQKFWACKRPMKPKGWSCVRADLGTPENDPHQVFLPTRVGVDVSSKKKEKRIGVNGGTDILQINLTSLSFNLHCRRRLRFPWYPRSDYLVTQSPITKESHITVEEAAKSIQAFNVSYYIKEAVIVRGNPTSVLFGEDYNDKDTINTLKFGYELHKEVSHTWNSSETTCYNTKIRITAPIPLYSGSGVEFDLSRKHEKQYMLGETTKSSDKIIGSYEPQVDGRKRVQALATRVDVTLRIPFSYDQKVTFYDGTVHIERKKHGVYSGMDALFLRFQSKEIAREEQNRTGENGVEQNGPAK